jgi:hypothetical protein
VSAVLTSLILTVVGLAMALFLEILAHLPPEATYAAGPGPRLLI